MYIYMYNACKVYRYCTGRYTMSAFKSHLVATLYTVLMWSPESSYAVSLQPHLVATSGLNLSYC